jgi:signal transduction histidine kinase
VSPVPTLRRKILLPIALLSVIAGLAFAFLGAAWWLEARGLQRSAEDVQTATTLAFALTDAVHEEERLVLRLRTDDAPGLAARLAEAGARVTHLSAEISARQLAVAASDNWGAFLRARASLATIRQEIFDAREADDDVRLALAFDKWTLLDGRAKALLRNFSAWHLRQLDRTVGELQARFTRSIAGALAAIAIGFLAAILFAVGLGSAVVRPISAMAATVERITEGSPPARVPGAERSDEIGVLSRALNGMTERLVAANARLAEAVRARDEFLSVASHELKTPLTSLGLRLGQLSRLAARGDDDPVSREVLARATAVMERQVVTLTKLVASLLDVTKIASGRLALQLEQTPVGEAVREVLEQLGDELAAARCPVRLEGDLDATVNADRVRLEQVLLNLLSNVVKYAPGAPVVVRIARSPRALTIEVEDSGPGIAPEDQERIFTRFERAVESDHVSGLGLGLFIAREIAHAHGGELTVASEPGRGARFTLRLPTDAVATEALGRSAHAP